MREIRYAAQRLANTSADFKLVMDHLISEQAGVVLSMDADSPKLMLAKIYFDALRAVPDLIATLAMEADTK